MGIIGKDIQEANKDIRSVLEDAGEGDENLGTRTKSSRLLCFDRDFSNIILLGLAFMFNVGANQTCGMAQTVILNSVKDEWFEGTPTMGYTTLAINFSVQAFSLFFGPALVSKIGPKAMIVAGSVCLWLNVACFIRPLAWTIYLGAAIAGFGQGSLWLLQGYFITINSTHATMGRNNGIFWAIFQSCLITGSLFYFFMLRGQSQIDEKTRIIVFSLLAVAGMIGTIFFCFLSHPWFGKLQRPNREQLPTGEFSVDSTRQAIVGMAKFTCKKHMLVLLPMFFFSGVSFAFWYNVYATSLGYTLRFGTVRESLVGLTGVFTGIGQITCGVVFGFLGKWTHSNGRDAGLLSGLLTHFLCYFLIFLNLPADSNLAPTSASSYVEPNQYLAMFCAVLLGFADGVWNNQLMSHLGASFPYETVAAFGLFQFWSSFGNVFQFVSSIYLLLPYQLLILVVLSLPAAFGFFHEEWKLSWSKVGMNKDPDKPIYLTAVEQPDELSIL